MPTTQSHSSKHVALLFVACVCALGRIPLSAAPKDPQARAKKQIEAATEAFHRDLNLLSRDPPQVRAVETVARKAAGSASQPDQVFTLVVLMSRDALEGGTSAENHLRAILAHDLDPWFKSHTGALNRRSAAFERQVWGCLVQLAYDEALPLPENLQGLGRLGGLASLDTGQAQRQLVLVTGINTLALGTDAYATISRRSISKVTTAVHGLASRKFSSAVANLTTSGSLAVADGPFPVGDAVALGFLGWTLHDLQALPDQFGQELEKVIVTQLGAMREQTCRELILASSRLKTSALQAVDTMTGEEP